MLRGKIRALKRRAHWKQIPHVNRHSTVGADVAIPYSPGIFVKQAIIVFPWFFFLRWLIGVGRSCQGRSMLTRWSQKKSHLDTLKITTVSVCENNPLLFSNNSSGGVSLHITLWVSVATDGLSTSLTTLYLQKKNLSFLSQVFFYISVDTLPKQQNIWSLYHVHTCRLK